MSFSLKDIGSKIKGTVKIGILIGMITVMFFSMAHSQLDGIIKYDQLEELILRENDTTYVFNFWATWCKPCVKELPYFEEINANLADEKVKVILVSLDFSDWADSKVIPFLQRREIQSDVYLLDELDANAYINKISPTWSGAIPATLVVSHSNDIREFYEQEFHSYDELLSILNFEKQ